ncbi:MAG: DUF1731 domain-containing protein, partial [Alphaproteobacteria bacterium]
GGALPKMMLPYKLFIGGPVGNGGQWTPWIHLADEIGAILFLLDRDDLEGPFNLVAPQQVKQKEFARALGKALGRPSFMPTPAFMLKLVFGEMAEELLLSGQRAVPRKLLNAGFKFQYTDLQKALADVL